MLLLTWSFRTLGHIKYLNAGLSYGVVASVELSEKELVRSLVLYHCLTFSSCPWQIIHSGVLTTAFFWSSF